MSTREESRKIEDPRIPEGYEITYHELRGYDSPDKWYEAHEHGKRKLGEYARFPEALEACAMAASKVKENGMADIFTVVSVGDGASIERLTREQLMERLNEKWWGDKPIHDHRAFDNGPVDLMATHGLFIIKGDCVRPKAKKVVETWEL